MSLLNILKGEQPLGYTLTIAAENALGVEAGADDKGQDGEFLTAYALEHGDIPGERRVWRNLLVPRVGATRTSEVDVLMLHERGVYVVESKNYSGWIYGSAGQHEWTASLGKNAKRRFYNPILQNANHIKALARELDLDPEVFVSLIVFSERCELKDVPQDTANTLIVQRQNLVRTVKRSIGSRDIVFDSERLAELASMIDALGRASDEKAKEAHVAEAKAVAEGRICPRCGRELVERRRRSDGVSFVGCSGYPACRYTRGGW